ncbi:MAG: tetratricopeptide repeat protein [Spirochaetales bacterium]|nr:tetratricopeptide repeat protein [Spirochaetales bacterium]
MQDWPNLEDLDNNLNDEEIQELNERLREKPEALTYFNLGLLEKRAGHLLLALEAFENSLTMAPEKAEIWNEIGLIYDEQGRLSAAERYYQKAIELEPEFFRAWNNWGVTAFIREDYPLARERFERAVALNPDSENGWLNLRDVCQVLGDSAGEARATLRLEQLELQS